MWLHSHKTIRKRNWISETSKESTVVLHFTADVILAEQHKIVLQMYSLTNPNNSIVLIIFTDIKVYKIQQQGLQTASRKTGSPSVNTIVKPWLDLWCHMCSKSSREISSLINIPHSAVSGLIKGGWDWDWQKQGHKVVGHVKSQSRVRCVMPRGCQGTSC